MIEFRGVGLHLAGHAVLHDVTFTARRGEGTPGVGAPRHSWRAGLRLPCCWMVRLC